MDFSPASGLRADAPGIEVPEDPRVFATWRPELEPRFEVVCEVDGARLSHDVVRLPSAPDAHAARIDVRTGACRAFVVRALRDPTPYRDEQARYVVRAASTSPERARPFVTAATREHEMYGCGPSSNLRIETNVRPAALRVEVEPGEHIIVAATRTMDAYAEPTEPGRVWLGHTMCRGPNLPESALDQAMRVRISALYTDGSTDVGPWQAIDPPVGDRKGRDGAVHTVEEPPPLPIEPGPSAPPTPSPDPSRIWLWMLLAGPGLLALAGWDCARRRRIDR